MVCTFGTMNCRVRRPTFPVDFYGDNRKRAQAIADKYFRGNLTAYLNHLIEADHLARKKKKA